MKLYPTIGLEIHAELLTNSKVFCTCSAEFGGEPNSRCCPVCSGLPGTLPVLNSKAVEYIIKAGYIMNCEISSLPSHTPAYWSISLIFSKNAMTSAAEWKSGSVTISISGIPQRL